MKEKERIIDGDYFDYLEWRGDLSFENSPFCEVDALILCQLSYIKLNDIVASDFNFANAKTLAECFEVYDKLPAKDYRKDLGVLINPDTKKLFESCASSGRFASLKLCGFNDSYDLNKEEQFCALTFVCEENKIVFVAFRGTDDTIVGWKEDFNLAFMDSIPAQKDSCIYLKSVLDRAEFEDYKIYAGGHSKGGNLAIYSCANNDTGRICKVFNFDGPGFSKKDLKSERFINIKDRVVSVFPQTSMVGMLFHHFDNYEVVKSSETLLLQHDPFSWHLKAKNFSTLKKLDEGSEIFFKSFNRWFEKLSEEQRREFVETLFGVLFASKAKTNSELAENGLKSAGRIIKAFASLESEKREAYLKIIHDFIKITGHEVKEFIK